MGVAATARDGPARATPPRMDAQRGKEEEWKKKKRDEGMEGWEVVDGQRLRQQLGEEEEKATAGAVLSPPGLSSSVLWARPTVGASDGKKKMEGEERRLGMMMMPLTGNMARDFL
jgi:hypothetical protein